MLVLSDQQLKNDERLNLQQYETKKNSELSLFRSWNWQYKVCKCLQYEFGCMCWFLVLINVLNVFLTLTWYNDLFEKDESRCAEVLASQTAHTAEWNQCLTAQRECKVTALDIHYSKTKWMHKQRAVLDSKHIWNPFNSISSHLVNQSSSAWEDFKPGHSGECSVS